jgi:cupin superfamily acireductone dioxygenase involved in methionine salvage
MLSAVPEGMSTRFGTVAKAFFNPTRFVGEVPTWVASAIKPESA